MEVIVLKIKLNSIICCILAAFMLFMTAYPENNELNAVNNFHTICHSCSFVDSFGEIAETNESCTIEMLGINNNFNFVSRNRCSSLRSLTKISLSVLCRNLFVNSISNIYMAVVSVGLPEPYYKTAVLDYIQNTDGKK